jgi:hypothetical protein
MTEPLHGSDANRRVGQSPENASRNDQNRPDLGVIMSLVMHNQGSRKNPCATLNPMQRVALLT